MKVLVAQSVQLFVTPCSVARQAPQSMGFSRQEYWSGVLFPSPWDLSNSGIEPTSAVSPVLAGRFYTIRATEEAYLFCYCYCCYVALVVSNSVRPHRWQPTRLPVPRILQARTLEWIAISFSNARKRKAKVKSLSHVRLQRPHGLQPTRLLYPWDPQAKVLEWGAIAFSFKCPRDI